MAAILAINEVRAKAALEACTSFIGPAWGLEPN